MARSIIALIMRMEEGASDTERVAGMVLHDKIHADSSTHPNSPYGTRSKVASSSSTSNLSSLQRFMSPTRKAAKRWCPPSPILPPVRSNSPTTTTTGGEWTSRREARDLYASGSSGKTAKVSAVLPKKLDPDTNEPFHGAETIPDKAHAPMPPSPLSPRRTRVSSRNLSVNSTSARTRACVACVRWLRVGQLRRLQ